MSDVIVVAPLSQGAGYGVVIGLGALFALGMIGITTILRKRGNVEDAEEFTGKSISRGYTNVSCQTIDWDWIDSRRRDIFLDMEVGDRIVFFSSRTYASTTLLSSVSVAYQYGVAGAFFYAACNSTQIMVFSNLAIVSQDESRWSITNPVSKLNEKPQMPGPIWTSCDFDMAELLISRSCSLVLLRIRWSCLPS